MKKVLGLSMADVYKRQTIFLPGVTHCSDYLRSYGNRIFRIFRINLEGGEGKW